MEHDDVEEPDDKNPINLEGYTPLHYAVQSGHRGAPHNNNSCIQLKAKTSSEPQTMNLNVYFVVNLFF